MPHLAVSRRGQPPARPRPRADAAGGRGCHRGVRPGVPAHRRMRRCRANACSRRPSVPRGMPYVLSVLTPPREEQLDPEALARRCGTDRRRGQPGRRRGVRTVCRHRPASARRSTAPRTGRSPNAFRSSTNRLRFAWTRGCRPIRFAARVRARPARPRARPDPRAGRESGVVRPDGAPSQPFYCGEPVCGPATLPSPGGHTPAGPTGPAEARTLSPGA